MKEWQIPNRTPCSPRSSLDRGGLEGSIGAQEPETVLLTRRKGLRIANDGRVPVLLTNGLGLDVMCVQVGRGTIVQVKDDGLRAVGAWDVIPAGVRDACTVG
jgi:hypothetical protein